MYPYAPMIAMRIMTGAKWKETLLHHTPHLKSGYVPLLLPLFLPEDGESGRLPTRVPSALTTSNRRLSPYFTEAIKIKLQDLGEIRIWELPQSSSSDYTDLF